MSPKKEIQDAMKTEILPDADDAPVVSDTPQVELFEVNLDGEEFTTHIKFQTILMMEMVKSLVPGVADYVDRAFSRLFESDLDLYKLGAIDNEEAEK